MENKYVLNIPIVVVGYNRAESLKRILGSLANGVYRQKVSLIISLDKSDNKEVKSVAEEFDWNHGEKKVICYPQHLGLRKHILACGNIALDYDGVILLEDDLFVSKYFYEYVIRAVNFYKDEDSVCGISLYNHQLFETAYLPFKPIEDGFDNYFLQIPSSWGQCWTRGQWIRFRKWYDKNQKNYIPPKSWLMPTDICNWPESSWKKYFFFYMLDTNTYFTYPRISLSSNFSDPGTHIVSKKQAFQVPLLYHEKKWRFSKLNESYSIYDSFCELERAILLQLVPESLFKDNFEVDLYGTKPLDKVKAEFLLSTKICNNPLMTFGREMRPAETNVIAQIPGNVISFGKRESFNNKISRSYTLKDILYFYDMVEWLHFKDIINGINKKNKKAKSSAEPIHPDNNDGNSDFPKISKIKMNYLRFRDTLKEYGLRAILFPIRKK